MPDDLYAQAIQRFKELLAEVQKTSLKEPMAMTLATADAEGRPSARTVLLRGVDERGFVFYTNLESRKGRQLAANAQAALCFHWDPLARQVHVEGAVERVSDAEADAYWATRPRDSQIGAWASQQSRPLDGRLTLMARVAQYAAKFAIGPVPRPPHWSGFRVKPRRIEFWTSRPFRLHDREVYEQTEQGWVLSRLYP